MAIRSHTPTYSVADNIADAFRFSCIAGDSDSSFSTENDIRSKIRNFEAGRGQITASSEVCSSTLLHARAIGPG